MKKENRLSTNPIYVLIAVACSVLLGLLFKKFSLYPVDSLNYKIFYNIDLILSTMGGMYLNFLEMTIYPIIISVIITSLSEMIRSKYLGLFIRKFILIYFIFFLVLSVLGVFSGIIFNLGNGFTNEDLQHIGEIIQTEKDDIEVSLTSKTADYIANNNFVQFLVNLFPKNIITALVNDTKFQVILASILLGVAIGVLEGKQRDYIQDFFSSILSVSQEIIRWLMLLLPLSLFCLLSTQFSTLGSGTILVMLKFLVAFSLTVLVLVVIDTLIIWKRSNKKLRYVLKALIDPTLMVLLSRSSYATLPVAMSTFSGKLNFFERTSNLILTFGVTVGRFGNIVYFAMVAVFAQNLYGLELTADKLGITIIGSVLAGIASTGTTGLASVGAMAFVLIPLGVPSEVIITIFIAIDFLINPLRTLLMTHTNMAASSLIIETIPQEGDRRLGTNRIRPRITLRASFIVLIIASIALSGITTFVVAYQGSKKSVYYVAKNMMNEMSSALVDKTTNYMDGAEALIRELKYMLENDNFNLSREDTFLQLLREMLEINENIGSMYIGRPDGSFTMVKRMIDGSISYRIIKRTEEIVTIDWIHENEENSTLFPDERLQTEQGYDPRVRGWYELALDRNELVWQDVYVFSSDSIPGITCAIPVSSENGLIGVLGIDIGVAEFSFFLGDLELSETGVAVLLNNKDELIAVSTKPTDKDQFDRFMKKNRNNSELELIPIWRSEDVLISGSYMTYLSTKNIQQLPVFYSEGEAYATYYKNFSPNAYFNWSIGIIIPEVSFMSQVRRNNIIVLTLGSFFITLSLLIGLKFSKSLSRPLNLLSSEMEKVRKFSLNDIEEVPSVIKEVNEMNDSFINMVTGLRSFNKYVPSNLVSKLILIGREAVIGGEKKVLTMFFSDIKNFTTICEQYDHDYLVKELEKYLNVMSKTIMNSSGTVDKYMGDGIMAFWGAPDEVEDHASLACYAALDCQSQLKNLARLAPNSLIADFYTRIGINTGEVIVGNMGSEERLDYTVIGDPANLASRLETLNKFYGTKIIISESTHDLVKGQVEDRVLDKVAVKGRSSGVKIYELISRKGEISRTMKQFLEGADLGASLYFNKEWEKAASVYNKLLRLKIGDVPSQVMLDRCQEYLKNPPPEEWTGVQVIHTK